MIAPPAPPRIALGNPGYQVLQQCLARAIEELPRDGCAFLIAAGATTLETHSIGWLDHRRAELLPALLPGARRIGNAVCWAALDLTPDQRSEMIEHTARELHARGAIRGWRNERYACLDTAGRELFRLERSAFRFFGLRSQAAHVNGWRADQQMWIARRAMSKAIDPGFLDNLAAGGISAGESARDCAIRELGEEAGINESLARHCRSLGTVTARRIEADGLHHEVLHAFELELPVDTVPTNRDAEVSDFYQLSIDEVVRRIEAGEFTGDAALVTARFLLQTG